MAVDAKTGQAIFHGATSVGLRNVGSYQVSGVPYITGSELGDGAEKKVSFPYVTKSITVIQSGTAGGDLRIHFQSTGSSPELISGHHYISMESAGDALTMNVKCKEVYLSAASPSQKSGFEIFAELTNIPTNSMFVLTGSGIDSGDGS